MPYWGDINFMDANSPVMEQLMFFYDHTMIVIISITVFLFCYMVDVSFNKTLSMGLMENQLIEFIWTVFPMFMLIFIAIPSLRLLYLMEESFFPLMTVKILGHQWFWLYEYKEFLLSVESFNESNYDKSGLDFYFRMLDSDMMIYLPMNVSIRLLVTSLDVIHSWTVQSLGVKTDAIPGRLNQLNFFAMKPGIYFGQCSEICGLFHSFMPISLMITDVQTFLDWLED